jgi:hypothetical protein
MEQTADDRFRVQRALATVHGEEIAALCMDLMPNVDTSGLVTRPDLDGAVVLVRKDMDHGFAAVRKDMDHRFSEMQQTIEHGFSELRAEIRAGFAEQGKVLAEQISSSVNQSLRWSIVTMVSMQAVLVAAIRLL